MLIKKKTYSLEFDLDQGRVTGLHDNRNPSADWTGPRFGIPFINGTQWGEAELEMEAERWSGEEIALCSASKGVRLTYTAQEESLVLEFETVRDCGPRIGLLMDFHFLDLEGGDRFTEQCMPKVIDTQEDGSFGYFIFGTGDSRYCTVILEEPFCAWRIHYEESGHRMEGFQILTQADDVVTEERPHLRTVDRLKIRILFGTSVRECMERAAEYLGIGIAVPDIGGGLPGARILFQLIGDFSGTVRVTQPSGEMVTVMEIPGGGNGLGSVELSVPGIYRIDTESRSGRIHTTRVLCHKDWKELFHDVNTFYAKYFQDESGAFYRAVWKESLSPKGGRTMEGTAFGDVEEHFSCRSGEFGGFAAAAMMKNLLLFGEDGNIRAAVDQYIRNWVLNEGHEETPFKGSICKTGQEFLGRNYGPYHLFQEVNYPQHEAFLMEQLVDYYRLTGERGILLEAYRLAEHFVKEHMEDSGCVVCQNEPDGAAVDYCTVHVPVYGLILVGKAMEEVDREKAEFLLKYAEKLADYVCRRGLSFPTEGEPCTEDGSMSCSALTLLLAYGRLNPKEKYVKEAKRILKLHEMLELAGTDCRMNGSSLRFWETQYETRDWGPSINAGHGWTIWTSSARILLALVDREFESLLRAYEGFLTNICKVENNGAMTSCYTPDMIPGLPHAPQIWGIAHTAGSVTEQRPTTARLGMRYPDRTYSTSGNFFLIQAAEFWSHISGYDRDSGVCINGISKDGMFVSGAPKWDCLLVGGGKGEAFSVSCTSGRTLTVLWNGTEESLSVRYGTVERSWPGGAFVIPEKDQMVLDWK